MTLSGGELHERNNNTKIQNACSNVLDRNAANGFLLRRIRVANERSSDSDSISIENSGSADSAALEVAPGNSVEVAEVAEVIGAVDGVADCFAATVGSLRTSLFSARAAGLPIEFCSGKESESDETVIDQSSKRLRKGPTTNISCRTYHHSSTDRVNDLRSRARIRLVGSKPAVKVDLIGVSATVGVPVIELRSFMDGQSVVIR